MENGALCVMTVGTLTMPMWCAVGLVTVELHMHLDEPSLVQAVVQSIMMTWPAMGGRHTWLTALIVVLEFIIAFMVKMQEQCVTVRRVSRACVCLVHVFCICVLHFLKQIGLTIVDQ